MTKQNIERLLAITEQKRNRESLNVAIEEKGTTFFDLVMAKIETAMDLVSSFNESLTFAYTTPPTFDFAPPPTSAFAPPLAYAYAPPQTSAYTPPTTPAASTSRVTQTTSASSTPRVTQTISAAAMPRVSQTTSAAFAPLIIQTTSAASTPRVTQSNPATSSPPTSRFSSSVIPSRYSAVARRHAPGLLLTSSPYYRPTRHPKTLKFTMISDIYHNPTTFHRPRFKDTSYTHELFSRRRPYLRRSRAVH